MGLCVSGKETLDELEEVVLAKFSAVKNKNIEAPHWEPIEHEKGPKLINVLPVKDTRSLSISFPCPDLDLLYYKSAVSNGNFHLKRELFLFETLFPSRIAIAPIYWDMKEKEVYCPS